MLARAMPLISSALFEKGSGSSRSERIAAGLRHVRVVDDRRRGAAGLRDVALRAVHDQSEWFRYTVAPLLTLSAAPASSFGSASCVTPSCILTRFSVTSDFSPATATPVKV